MKPNLHHHHHPHWRRGISRPEVAVVLLVLGMLGMLVAGFISLSAERGRETACSINVKRLVVAFQNHAADRSNYPASGRLGEELPEDWVHWQGRRRIEQSALAPWLGEISSRTMTCPEDMDTRHRSFPFSYTMNMYLHLMPANALATPATTVVVFEEERPNDGACLPGHPNDRLAHRHSHGRSQAGFADGSVRLVRPDVGAPTPQQ